MITYVDWNKHNSIDKAVKLLRDKLLYEQAVRDERVIETLCIYFRKACVLLSEDPSNQFFKNGIVEAKEVYIRMTAGRELSDRFKQALQDLKEVVQNGGLAQDSTAEQHFRTIRAFMAKVMEVGVYQDHMSKEEVLQYIENVTVRIQ